MSDLSWTGAAMLALLSWPLLPLLDVLRHPQAAPAAPATDRGAMTTQGVPYVLGVPVEG